MNFKHLLLVGILASAGCSTINNLLDNDTGIDYKSSKAAQKLEVPPDLTQLRTTDRFNSARTASASNPVSLSGGNNAVLPANSKARIERLGNARYLVVDMPADQVFPIVASFWKDLGFTLAIESPQTGLLETDWAENRNKAPAQGLRKLLGGIFDNLTDSGERDRYRTRLERVGNTTEIYLSHRGTKEVSNGSKTDFQINTIRRDGSIELESDFLRRLMLRFGVEESAAKVAASAGLTIAPDRARLIAGKDILEIDDAYDTAWRRVGLALDRSGFTIDDRNFGTGEYFIRYARDLNANDTGFFSKWFSGDKKGGSKKLKLVLQKGVKTNLVVQSDTGAAAEADITKSLLAVMREELK
jgi:outer membrane protein assembly factor BamC